MMATRRMMFVLFMAGIVLSISAPVLAQVRTWEGTITIPTYGWEEDINPKFWAMEGAVKGSTTVHASIIYPYTMQDHLFRTKADRTYKALFLENEYLKITCLPELGGRLHSVLDKTEGKETFHLNRVIKPSMIAMRGAFISGGVEWNAGPQVHTVTILSPVNALIGHNEDGSAFLEISNLEKSLRNRWTVRVTLHPGVASLDERICLVNPVDAINPYYFWNCTAYPTGPGTRFIYPMTLGTDHHGISFFSWPVHEGKDLSWLKNHETWSSIFSVNCVYDFFGAYDVEADRGVVQVANHHELGGKKAWTWGTWDYGLVSQQNLTDEDGPYIEVQSGPLPTQSDYGSLGPRQAIAWQEWWYPVHGLGDGFEYATKDLAVQRIEKQNGLELRLIAVSHFPATVCTLSQNDKTIFQKQWDLTPKEARVISVAPVSKGPISVTIARPDGTLLARYTTPLPIRKETPPDPASWKEKPDDELTVEETYLRGLQLDRALNRPRARHYYEMALAADERHHDALLALAVLDIEAARYREAAERIEKALARKPNDDGQAWYFLGICHFKMGDYESALRCGYQAARCFGTTSLGDDLIGRASMRLGRTKDAVSAFARAMTGLPHDPVAKDHYLIALYAAGRYEEVWNLAQQRVRDNPSWFGPRAVLALRDQSSMDQFATDAHAFLGEVEFEIMEVCLRFAELGLTQEATKLARAVCIDHVEPSARSPIPYYYVAYFSAVGGDSELARQYLAVAAETSRDFVFPSRPEAVNVFKYALQTNPDDAYGHLHLGNLYGNLGRLEEAVSHWQRAVELNPQLSVAYRNLGLYAWTKEEDLKKATAWYQKAIAARPADQTLYRDLAEILIDSGKRPEAIRLLESMPYEKMKRADIIVMLAGAYLDSKRYTEVLDLLASTPYFVNWEGSSVTRDIFCRAHMQRGQERLEQKDYQGALEDFEAAVTYPENLGVGRTNRPEEAAALYWKGIALQSLDRPEEARAAWQAGAAGSEGSETQNKYRALCAEALR
ncbi:MAG: DUF5107 domain-containing protein [Pirellulales bacterium]|nr:DUF5107 domain-containing protein [Pirellulales bacterium]